MPRPPRDPAPVRSFRVPRSASRLRPAQQGYPISDEFTEISDLNGQPYTVQYFERAVFERHPENAPPYDVLLSQLGTFQHRAKYEGGPATVGPAPPTSAPVPPSSPPVQPTAVPTAVPAPAGAYAASASVSDGAPTWNEHVTVSGRLTRGGPPVAGVTMHTIWNYKTTTSYCDGTTGSSGVASCERSTSHATKGYTVVINVVFQDASGGTLATTSTSFTPR